MDSLRFDDEDLPTNLGSDLVHTDDSIDISQLEGYLGASCADDYAIDSSSCGQLTLHHEGAYLQHHPPHQLHHEPSGSRSGILSALPSSSHLSFVSSAGSTEALLAMPESPPYSSGSEPYSPEQLATVAGHRNVGPLSSRVPVAPAGDFLLPVPSADDRREVAIAAAGQRPGRGAVYATVHETPAAAIPLQPAHVAPSIVTGVSSSIGMARSRYGVMPGKKRKASAAEGGAGSSTVVSEQAVGIELLPDATQLLLHSSSPPARHHAHQHQLNVAHGESGELAALRAHALKQEAGNPSQVASTSGSTFADDLDDYPYVMDITLRPIKWQQFEGGKPWCQLLDGNAMPVKIELYDVDADKGFNFSPVDDSFVCQKKNHFQVTSTIVLSSSPTLFCLPDGSLHPLEGLYYHFYGVKKEAVKQVIRVEQSQSDRSKRPFQPIRVAFVDGKSAKSTVGRLHFTETTINNMRKKGKPNPEQRYFLLVSGIYAHSAGSQPVEYPIIEMASEKIIVRASNPGQFESDIEIPWHKSGGIESIYHYGTVGINTDKPDEALVVNGNVKLMGCVVQPSDERIKEKIEEVDTKEQLARLAQLRMYRFKFRPDFGAVAGLGESDLDSQTGVLAQELRNILPEAVRDAGDLTLANGEYIENLLVVNKDRLFMESVGAVKELCKVTETLESRMHEIEKVNRKLAQLKRLGSIKSASSDDRGAAIRLNGVTSRPGGSAVSNSNDTEQTRKSNSRSNNSDGSVVLSVSLRENKKPLCTDKAIRSIVAVLIVTMTICLAAIVALYMLEKPRLMDEALSSRFPPPLPGTSDGTSGFTNRSKSSTTAKPAGTVFPIYKTGSDYYSTVCTVPSISSTSVTCCGNTSCVCHPCPYVPLSSFAEAQWLLRSPTPTSLSPTSAGPLRKKRQDSVGDSPADPHDLFKELNATLYVEGSSKVMSITRSMCINCHLCRRSCSNLTVLMLVHASLPPRTTATLTFSSVTDMLMTFRGMANTNVNGTCSTCSAEPRSTDSVDAPVTTSTTSAKPNLPAGSGSDGSPTDVPTNAALGVSRVGLITDYRGINATYVTPASYSIPIGAFSRHLYAFRITCTNSSSSSACQVATAGRGSIDLYVDVLRTCNTCADSIIAAARLDLAFIHNVLDGGNRRR